MSSDLFSLLASKGPAPEITVHFPGSLPFTMRPIDYHHPGVDHRSFRSLSQGDDEEYHILASAPRKDGENTTFDYTAWSEKEWPAVTFCGDRRPDDDVQTSTSGSTQVRSQRLALKFANRVGARHDGFGNILHERYLEEAVFYAETLKGLQGEAVPIHYGVWTGSAPWGATVTCAIMQWAGDPYTRRIRTIERSLKVVEAAHALHNIGLQHFRLGIGFPDFHHILYDTDSEKAFIIDFKESGFHPCNIRVPVKQYKTRVPEYVFGCSEMWALCRSVGLFSDSTPMNKEIEPELWQVWASIYEDDSESDGSSN